MKRKSAKILSIILSIVLIFSLSATAFAGEADDAYTIATAQQLSDFSKAVAEGNSFEDTTVILTADITADSSFAPIGTKEAPFAGVFNGNGKKISGISPDCDYAGLFAYTDGAEITDLTVSGDIFATKYAGGIVAYAVDTVISNCTGSANVYADNYTGGIAGYMESGAIIGCTTSSTPAIIGYEAYTGGILGAGKADITDCGNYAYVQGGRNVGGIAGSSSGNITGCINTVRVEAGANNCGGIAGYTNGTIAYCKNTGAVAGTGKTGGITGISSSATVKECLSSGAVSATDDYAGGIAGYVTGSTIADCVSVANVLNVADFAAGIAGYCSASSIERCLSLSAVTSFTSTGSAICAVANGTIRDCYFDSTKSDKAYVTGTAMDGATGITASEIATAATYTNWDFNKVWAINEAHATYPLLINAGYHTLSTTETVSATCVTDGYTVEFCSLCHETVTTIIEAKGHDYKIVSIRYATCSAPGYKDSVCNNCGDAVSENEAALPHTDADTNEICDDCGKDLSVKQTEQKKTFFQKIVDFFTGIFDWFRNLFR